MQSGDEFLEQVKTKVSELGRTSECGGDDRGFHIPQYCKICTSIVTVDIDRAGKNSRDRAKQVKICEGN